MAVSTSVLLGTTTAVTATVSNTTNTAVSWSVNGIPGGNAQVGTISSGGLFLAPGVLPSPPTVDVQAASVADPTKTAEAVITIISDIGVSLSPMSAATELGSQQMFEAGIISAGNPSTGVSWTLSGAGCSGAACGAVSSSGMFTAPQNMPAPPTLTITVTSTADPSKKAAATVTVTSNFTFMLTGPSSIAVGASASFAATLTPVPNSNPNPAISWSVSGTGCSGASCGIVSAVGSGASATYTAPTVAPSPALVSVTATPVAAPLKTASIALQITAAAAVTVVLAPVAATLSVNDRETFTAQVQNSANTGVLWNVNGVAGGSATLGQVCVVASNPCQMVTSANAGSVDYVAPSAVPSPNPVTLSVVSQANAAVSASSGITILPHVVVSVLPPSVTLAPGASRDFAASVAGTTNQQVIWTITGAACSAAGSPCGTIDPTGLYQAPATIPSPNTLSVVATSAEDSSRSASSIVTITAQPTILSLLPSSITAGAAGGFALLVQGANFVPAGAGPGSSILIGGNQRITTCDSSSDCSTLLSSSDVALATSLNVMLQNPDGTLSNTVNFIVVPATSGVGEIALTPGAPNVTGKDIVVTDLSTDGSSSPLEDVSLSVAAIGSFQPATDTCTLGAGAVSFVLPASGQAISDICVFSVSGLDPSYSYTLTGPSPNDMSVVGEAPLGLGIVDLTLQLSSTTASGTRTLFIQNASLDITAATGVLRVQ
jgi:predicted secreted protein